MESNKVKQRLKESEEKFRLIIESISDPLHVVDAELKFIYLNPAFIEWLKVLGLNHEIIGKTLQVDQVDVSTVNCGSPYLGGGAITNDSEAIFGRESTGPELQRMMEILNLQ